MGNIIDTKQPRTWLYICISYVILKTLNLIMFGFDSHTFPDSLSYSIYAHHDIFGLHPTAKYCYEGLCNRAFVYPLTMFLLSYKTILILIFQLVVSVFAWISLANILRKEIKNNSYHNWIAASILIISLQTGLTVWDNFILSESLSVSFFILTICTFWQFITKSMPWRWLIVLIAITVLSTGIRDTNAYLMLLAAIILFSLTMAYNRGSWLKALLYLICVVIMFSFSSWTNKIGHRGAVSMNNIIALRILHKPEPTAYFHKHGMPTILKKQTLLQMGAIKRSVIEGTMASVEFISKDQPGSNWVKYDSKKVFTKFLLTHPKYAFMPFVTSSFYLSWLANPLITYYFTPFNKHTSTLVIETYLMFSTLLILISSIILLCLLFRFFTNINNIKTSIINKRLANFGLANIILSLIMAWLIWQAGPMGIMRHQLLAYVQLVIGIIFLAFATLYRN